MRMVLSLLLALAAIAILYWMGTISIVVAGAALLVIVICLALFMAGRVLHVSYLTKQAKALRAKWAGALTLISGLPTVVDAKFYLFISRRDELIIENKDYNITLPLSQLTTILIISAGALANLSDAEIAARMKISERPNLSLARDWVRRHPDAVNQKLVLFWCNEALRQQHGLTDIIMFTDNEALGDLTALLRRPEIALKTTVIEEKASVARKQRTKQTTEGHTEPFIGLAPEDDKQKDEQHDH